MVDYTMKTLSKIQIVVLVVVTIPTALILISQWLLASQARAVGKRIYVDMEAIGGNNGSTCSHVREIRQADE
jgi:hypothetical protein